GQQFFQPGVLALQPLQPLCFRDPETAVFGFPVVKAPLTNPVLAAEIGRFHPGLVLLQDPNDLLFRISLALHRLVLSKGQTPIHSGSIQGGNVNVKTKNRHSGERPWRILAGMDESLWTSTLY